MSTPLVAARRSAPQILRSQLDSALLPLGSTLLLCGLWEVLARTVLPPQVRPFSSTVAWLVTNARSDELWGAVGQTLTHWAAGLAVALAAGSVVGLATGSSRWVDNLLSGLFEFVRPIPAIVYLPLMLLVMGATSQVAITLAASGAFWPILYQVHYGVGSIDPVARDTARVFGLSRAQRLRSVSIPSVLPFLATGVRIASSIALLGSVVMEMLGGVPGLGSMLARDSSNGLYDAMYGILLATGLLGLALNAVFARTERTLLRWHPGYRPVEA
ncbi:ABC transporter permease [Dactylosporangium sp. CA-233914]|uniref:ABC transporter permease n=1 Tax=Dactylosporangium sp. CA-233914 TaxID=3239934 RepID=UPI003D8BAFC7